MLETILNNFHLEKILWILQKRIAYIMILGVLGGMAGGAYAYLTNSTLYRAEVSFYVYSDPDYVYDSSVNISNSEFTQAKNLVQSYILILKSNTILQKVLEEAGLDYGTEGLSGRIGTSVVENTAVFYVYTYDSDPYRAMELANAIGRVAPKEIGRIVKSGGIEVIDYATLPEAPYSSTSLVKYALVGFAGCFGASFVLFLLAGLMDTTIRRRYELKLAFRIPVLGDIPQIQAPDPKIKDALLRRDSNLSTISSALKSIMSGGVDVNGKTMYLSDFGVETLGYFEAPDNEKNAYHIAGDPDDANTSGKSDVLKSMISNDPDTVIAFFSSLSKNLYTKMSDLSKSVDGYRSYGNFYDDKKMTSDYNDYKTKISELEEKLNDYEDKWYSKFSKMETALAKLQSNSSAVTSLLGGS